MQVINCEWVYKKKSFTCILFFNFGSGKTELLVSKPIRQNFFLIQVLHGYEEKCSYQISKLQVKHIELHILKIKNIECVHKIPSYSLGDRGKYHCTITSLHEVFMKFLLSLAAVEYIWRLL